MTDATDLGMSLPQGGDLISGGDDAIRHNAERTSTLLKRLQDDVFTKARPATGPDLNTVTTPGLYDLSVSGVTNGPVAGFIGTLLVMRYGANHVQVAWTRDNPPAMFMRGNSGGSWQPWTAVGGGKALSRSTLTTQNLNDVRGLGMYDQTTTSNATPERNYPAASRGVLVVYQLGDSGCTQLYIASWTRQQYVREYYGGTWSAWQRTATGSDLDALTGRVSAIEQHGAGGGSGNTAPDRHGHLVRLARARQLIGTRTTTRATVALVCDHGTVKFRDIVLPRLQARGLVCTLALNAGRLDAGYLHAGTEVGTWSQITQWADAGIEIANHGRTHRDTAVPSQIAAEIVTGHAELEQRVGRPIHSWVQPSATGDAGKWGGFNDGSSWAAYMGTDAGRMILDQHAVVTGTISHPTKRYQLDGTPPLGAQGYWIDSSAQFQPARDAVTAAEAEGTGVLLRLHPQWIGSNNTQAEVEGLIDWLADEQEAGRIDVVTLTQWGLTRHAGTPAEEIPPSGASSWDDLTGKPSTFPPSAHTHDDRYYTEAEVDAKVTAARPYDSGPRRFTPTGGIIDPANAGSIILHRIGNTVYCRIDGLMVIPGALETWLWPNGIPAGFTIGEFGQVVDVTGGYTSQAGMNGAVRHRLTVYQNDLRYVGYLHGATATTVEASRSDQTRRIYGWLPAWLTPDPIPTTPVGEPA